MVCNRCIMVVRQKFEKAGLRPADVNMGEIELSRESTDSQLKRLSSSLNELIYNCLSFIFLFSITSSILDLGLNNSIFHRMLHLLFYRNQKTNHLQIQFPRFHI